MSEQLPAPEFDATQYERPNCRWICGRAAEGHPCRIGPGPRGDCRATSECTPALQIKPGETKGRWRCTRPKSAGGPCSEGPLPNGACSHVIPPCQPVRSLRAKRALATLWTVALTLGGLLVALYGNARWNFITPRELSSHHTGAAFEKSVKLAGRGNNCAACHTAARRGPAGWVQAALLAEPGPLEWGKLSSVPAKTITRLDQSCERCHALHEFHQPNVGWNYSCSACHREHEGAGPMKAPANAECLSCHGNASVMQASVEKARTLPSEAFHYHTVGTRVAFQTPRPPSGYTQVFHSFADHPEFQVVAEHLRDPDTLKFNHQTHLTGNIPLLDGHKLACADCHKPDATGAYMRPVTYEANCRSCHALQFDVNNPELQLPHGNAAAVRAFLRSLQTQYADFGRRVKGITQQPALEEFVGQQMAALHQQVPDGEELEREAYFNTARQGPDGRPRYAGCAYCHEVKPMGEGTPLVTPPVMPDRWLTGGRFDHARHATMACATCHDALHSHETADILLPSKQVCASCHSPQGGASSSCASCHNYHNTPVTVTDFAGTWRTADARPGK